MVSSPAGSTGGQGGGRGIGEEGGGGAESERQDLVDLRRRLGDLRPGEGVRDRCVRFGYVVCDRGTDGRTRALCIKDSCTMGEIWSSRSDGMVG